MLAPSTFCGPRNMEWHRQNLSAFAHAAVRLQCTNTFNNGVV